MFQHLAFVRPLGKKDVNNYSGKDLTKGLQWPERFLKYQFSHWWMIPVYRNSI